jgi:predicted aspartyl protease
MQSSALTVKSDGIMNVIKTQVGLSLPFTGEEKKDDIKISPYQGIWDTGASNSVITKKVIDELGLQPISKVKVHTASGEYDSDVFLVNVVLPGNVAVAGVRVTEGKISGADTLIGMYIINMGDFSITNYNNKTTMSFRTPSLYEIDYVKETRKESMNRHERRAVESIEKRK